MPIRVATFNTENLFTRPLAMSDSTPANIRADVLDAFARLGAAIEQDPYSAADQKTIRDVLKKYGPAAPKAKRFIKVEEVRERLFSASGGTVTVKAAGRSAWVGWVDLIREDVDRDATRNTGRVVQAVNADVLLTVEVEDRLTLQRFNDQVLLPLNAAYEFNLLVDGNDERGIDLGILSRFPIRSIRPHLFDVDAVGPIFSRDCPEFEIELPSGATFWVLGNHWKSKGYGSPATTTAKRLRQATRVEQIYQEAVKRGDLVAIMGDLNDTPTSAPVQVLTGAGLQDVMSHASYTQTPGTYGTGNTQNQKIDYIFLSPKAWAKVSAVGVERRGVYAPSLASSVGPLFATSKLDQASDHSAVWVDLNV